MELKKNLDAIIYDQFLNSIFNSEWSYGDVISPDALAEHYHVSRTPVIHALKRLASDGVISFKSNGKPWFPVVSVDDVLKIIMVRRMFDLEAVRQICMNRIPVADEKLLAIVNRCEHSRALGMDCEASRDDLTFHRMVIDSVANPFFSEMYDRVQKRFIAINYLTLQDHPGQFVVTEHSSNDHRALFDALSVFDLQAAEQIVCAHLQNALDYNTSRLSNVHTPTEL